MEILKVSRDNLSQDQNVDDGIVKIKQKQVKSS